MARVPPTRSNWSSWSTRSNAIWVSEGSSPISSRKIVPECANSKRPCRRCRAPVNAPFSWPNNSEAMSEGGIAAQFTVIKAWPGAPRTLMYGARNQFLSGTCFARNQHRRVGGSDFHDAGKDGFQGGRGAHDLLKHGDLIDLLPERHVLVMKAIFQPLNFFESFLQFSSSLRLFGD